MTKEKQIDKLKSLGDEFIYALIDNPYECPIVIDKKGIIRFMSRFSRRLIGIDPEEAVGRHIKDVIKETRLHEILKDGKARIADLLYIAGRQQVISRIPLKDLQGRILGAVGKGVFSKVSKVAELSQRIEHLSDQVKYYKQRVTDMRGGSTIVGGTEAILRMKENALLAAKSNASVLITGESGTGKEVVAYFIHQNSSRSGGPFIRVNCASIPRELFESELFGYEGGAFTGARSQGKPGKFELANGGTILLDEIGEMPRPMQAKLLRVLQERTVDRLGGTKPIPADFRLIAATNRDLQEMVRKGDFRMDLFYRINILSIHAPSLRDIRGDIPLLAAHLIGLLNEEMGWGASAISPEAMEELKRYDWPGNVRELRNVIERAMIIAKERVIRPEDLPDRIRGGAGAVSIPPAASRSPRAGNLRLILAETERQVILETLRNAGGNKAKAAKMLGIHRTSLYQKMRMHGMDPDGEIDFSL
ncbi:MAG TPA: sigma 54-interacting transcriptional regulator [Syntrophales bacterium]|nr:sigma 54-interacting transcriptional regulator [Syntrophobacterales bacterium]HQL89890.1 sigma 54-interacting transcriptional regulator [Syntrophales bacterium]